MPFLADLYPDGAWSGRRCFVIGRGPSARGFNWDKLRHELTIGINEVWRLNPTITISEDVLYQDRMSEDWPFLSAKTVRVFHNVLDERMGAEWHGIHSIDSSGRFIWSKSLKDGLCHGSHSGVSAINLAECLGANPIYLIGFDYKTDGGRVHWDDRPVLEEDAKRTNYRWFLEDFPHVKSQSRARIVNLNKRSALRLFPFGNFPRKVKSPVYVSYAAGEGYADELRKLEDSAKLFNLETDFRVMYDLGSWQENVRAKPRFILQMMEEHPGRPVVWVDSDARFRRYPAKFDNAKADVMIHRYRPDQVMGGTVYLSGSEKSKDFLLDWISSLGDYPDDPRGDMQALGAAVDVYPEAVEDFGPEYCWIFDAMPKLYPMKEPVIEHMQASRRLKEKDDESGSDG